MHQRGPGSAKFRQDSISLMIKRSTLSRLLATAFLAAPTVFFSSASSCFAAPPANDSFANAVTLVTGTPLEGTTREATLEAGEPMPPGYDEDTYARTVWWTWMAPVTGRFDITARGNGFAAVVAVWTGDTPGALTPVPEVDTGVDSGGTATGRARIEARAGTVYRIATASRGIDFDRQGAFTLMAAPSPPPPPNDHFANRIPLTTGTLWQGPAAGATREAGEPRPPSGRRGDVSIWFTWTAPSTGWFYIEKSAGFFWGAQRLAAWTGSDPAGLQPVQAGGYGSNLLMHAAEGTIYQMALITDTWDEPPEEGTLIIRPGQEHYRSQITSFTVTPGFVDVTGEDRVVNVVFTAKAYALPGNAAVVMRFADREMSVPFTSAHLTSGTPMDGTWTVPILIPRHFTPAVVWFSIQWDTSERVGMVEDYYPFATPTAPYLRITNTGAEDKTEPVLASVELSPGTVDITEGDRETTVTVRAVDALSGVRRISVFLKRSQTGMKVSTLVLDAASRVSGTARDGLYTGTLTVPGYLHPGVHALEAEVEDLNGNRREWSAEKGNPLPGPSSGGITVRRDTRIHIRSLTADPDPLDMTAGSRDLTVTFRLTADKGAVLSSSSFLRFDADGVPGGPALRPVNFGAPDRIQGTDADGIYQVRFVVPEGMPPGDYQASLYTQWVIFGAFSQQGWDSHGWKNPDETGELYPWPAGVPQTVRVVNHGTVDTEAPTAELTVPNPVMIREKSKDGGGWRLDYQLTVTDNVDRSPGSYIYMTDGQGGEWPGDYGGFRPLRMDVRTPPGSYFLAVMTVDEVGNTRTWRSDMPDFPGPFRGAVTVPVAIDMAPFWSAWKAEVFNTAQADDAAISGENADPDADGLTNLMEYALGLPPLQPDNPAAAMPELVRPEGGGSGLQLRCTRAAGRRDLIWTVQEAPTPSGPWTPIQIDPQVPQETNVARETIFWHISPSATGTGFLRLQITRH
ncbi:MAG: hypothetical protein JWM59_203 [Verrucomicrobiales bacterium]|nr:hypothetical protein [Verrucomicrobiales bacterium]